MKTRNKTLFLAQAAVIAAAYTVLCIAFAPISYGEIQVRIAEALVILPFFTPAACPTPHHAMRNASQYLPQSTRVLAAEYCGGFRTSLMRILR